MLALLGQCPLAEMPPQSHPALVAALLRLAPTAAQERAGAAQLCEALLSLLRQLAREGAEVAAVSADAMLQQLLAAAKGAAPQVSWAGGGGCLAGPACLLGYVHQRRAAVSSPPVHQISRHFAPGLCRPSPRRWACQQRHPKWISQH